MPDHEREDYDIYIEPDKPMTPEIKHVFQNRIEDGQGGGGPQYRDVQGFLRREVVSPNRDREKIRNLEKDRELLLNSAINEGFLNPEVLSDEVAITLRESDKRTVRQNLQRVVLQYANYDSDDYFTTTPQEFRGMRADIVNGVILWADAVLNPNLRVPTGITQEAYFNALFKIHAPKLTVSQDEILEAFKREPQIQVAAQAAPITMNAQAVGREVGREVGRALNEGKLGADKQYKIFLADTRWPIKTVSLIGEENAPSYWPRLTETEQKINNICRELANAAWYKRNKVGDMKSYSDKEFNPLAGVSKTELKTLYNEMPGFRPALETYVSLLNNPQSFSIRRQNGDEITLLQAGDKREVDQIRKLVEASLISSIRDKMVEDLRREGRSVDEINEMSDNILEFARQKALEAEQAGFNFLFAGNVFEAASRKWEDTKRVNRQSVSIEELVNPTLIQAMYPLDTLLDKAHKNPQEYYGGLGSWFANQLSGIGASDYKFVQVVPFNNVGDVNKWWVVKNNTLYIPECYPSQVIGSILDETRIGNTSFKDLLSQKREIPWDLPEVQNMCKDYLGKAEKCGVFISYQIGKNAIGGKDWSISDLNSSIAKLNLINSRYNKEREKWIVYSSRGGLKKESKSPKLIGTYLVKETYKNTLKLYGGQFTKHDAFFPGDGTGSVLNPFN